MKISKDDEFKQSIQLKAEDLSRSLLLMLFTYEDEELCTERFNHMFSVQICKNTMQLFGQSLALFSKEKNKRITKKWDDQETQVNLQEITLF